MNVFTTFHIFRLMICFPYYRLIASEGTPLDEQPAKAYNSTFRRISSLNFQSSLLRAPSLWGGQWFSEDTQRAAVCRCIIADVEVIIHIWINWWQLHLLLCFSPRTRNSPAILIKALPSSLNLDKSQGWILDTFNEEGWNMWGISFSLLSNPIN